MLERRIEWLYIAILVIPVMLFLDAKVTLWLLPYLPVALLILGTTLLALIGAVGGLGIIIKRRLNRQSFRPELLILCAALFFNDAVAQAKFGFQNIDLKNAHDYSTDIVNPPQFLQTKDQRQLAQTLSARPKFVGLFLGMPVSDEIFKADTDSIVLPLSGLDSKFVLKRAIECLDWSMTSYLVSSRDHIDFSEAYQYQGYGDLAKQRSSLAVSIISTPLGSSVIDIRVSSPTGYRTFGASVLLIRQLASEILLLSQEFVLAQNLDGVGGVTMFSSTHMIKRSD
jgi:hypothetical protein|tara:strand:- start:2911 stop:3759 length:849 start_codon:yes stop_codon:yes gene_type:complete